MGINRRKKPRSKAQKSNWQLPSSRDSDEELSGDLQEQQNHSHFVQNSAANYVINILQNVQWGLAKSFTANQTTHLKLKDNVTLPGENDDSKREYQSLLLQKAKWSFYGSFLGGVLGLTMNCVGFGMVCFGQTNLGVPIAAGGFGLEASVFFMQKISKDANDRLDSYFNNEQDEDKDIEEGEG